MIDKYYIITLLYYYKYYFYFISLLLKMNIKQLQTKFIANKDHNRIQ